MNTSKLSQGQMIAAAGGVLLIVSLFLHWAGGRSGWSLFSDIQIIMLLVGIAAIAWAFLPAVSTSGPTVTVPTGAPTIVAALGVAVFGFAAGWELEASGDIGVWLGIVASLAIAYGAWSAARAPAVPVAHTRTPASPTAPPAV